MIIVIAGVLTVALALAGVEAWRLLNGVAPVATYPHVGASSADRAAALALRPEPYQDGVVIRVPVLRVNYWKPGSVEQDKNVWLMAICSNDAVEHVYWLVRGDWVQGKIELDSSGEIIPHYGEYSRQSVDSPLVFEYAFRGLSRRGYDLSEMMVVNSARAGGDRLAGSGSGDAMTICLEPGEAEGAALQPMLLASVIETTAPGPVGVLKPAF